MKTSSRKIFALKIILCCVALASACDNGGNNHRTSPPPQGGSTGGQTVNNSPAANNPNNTPTKQKMHSPQELAQKTELTAYHALVRDGDLGYSGYCMASQKRPVSLDDGIRQIEIKEGPCPASLKINNKTTPMVYACPVKTAANGDKEQIFLYETMHTDHGFEKLTDIDFDVPAVFCGM